MNEPVNSDDQWQIRQRRVRELAWTWEPRLLLNRCGARESYAGAVDTIRRPCHEGKILSVLV